PKQAVTAFGDHSAQGHGARSCRLRNRVRAGGDCRSAGAPDSGRSSLQTATGMRPGRPLWTPSGASPATAPDPPEPVQSLLPPEGRLTTARRRAMAASHGEVEGSVGVAAGEGAAGFSSRGADADASTGLGAGAEAGAGADVTGATVAGATTSVAAGAVTSGVVAWVASGFLPLVPAP